MCNFNKFKDIFIIFGKNHSETYFTKILENFPDILACRNLVLT